MLRQGRTLSTDVLVTFVEKLHVACSAVAQLAKFCCLCASGGVMLKTLTSPLGFPLGNGRTWVHHGGGGGHFLVGDQL